jgi:hypothetical protein
MTPVSHLHCPHCRAIFDPELWPQCPSCGAVGDVFSRAPEIRELTNSEHEEFLCELLTDVDDAVWQRIKTWRDGLRKDEV